MSVPVIDPQEFIGGVGTPEFHAVITIQLGELIEDEIFTWEKIGWINAAYSPEQYTRLCEAFEARFYLDEISCLPVGHWMRLLKYELVHNLMPKYRPLYAQLEAGDYDPLQTGGEYRKERKIESEFPETLLTENQDYASKGYDFVAESVGRGNMADDLANYAEKVSSLDNMLLDEIQKKLFTCLYSTNVNAW